jgi:hypothetical protein
MKKKLVSRFPTTYIAILFSRVTKCHLAEPRALRLLQLGQRSAKLVCQFAQLALRLNKSQLGLGEFQLQLAHLCELLLQLWIKVRRRHLHIKFLQVTARVNEQTALTACLDLGLQHITRYSLIHGFQRTLHNAAKINKNTMIILSDIAHPSP